MDRIISTISEKVGKLLVKQLSHEMFNHNLYRTFSNFFANESILDLEKYYDKRAEEELVHHKWIMDRLNEADFSYSHPVVPEVDVDLKDVETPFVMTVEKEIETTGLIYEIADACLEEKDWQTLTWLQQHLIPEQHEEESTSRTALDIMAREDSIFIKAGQVYNLLG